MGLSFDTLAQEGSVGGDKTIFWMPAFAIKFSRYINGVSKLHGDVSKSMWADLFPEHPEAEIPITSNLYTLLTAIKAHGSTLEHIWLLGTADPKEGKGSGSILADLTDYIGRNRESLGLKKDPKIEHLETIPMDFDNQVTECVRKTVDEVFDHAAYYGLKQSDIIADCTGGTKSMTLGVILACLEEDRDIQLVGSRYKEDGRPDGSSAFPMIFEYTTSRAEYNK